MPQIIPDGSLLILRGSLGTKALTLTFSRREEDRKQCCRLILCVYNRLLACFLLYAF